MSFFVTIITLDLTYVFLFCDLSLIDSGGRVGGLLLVFMLFPPPASPGLVQRLGILGGSGLGSFSLRLVPAVVFRCSLGLFRCSLGLDLVSGSVGGPVPLKDLLISLPYVEIWL